MPARPRLHPLAHGRWRSIAASLDAGRCCRGGGTIPLNGGACRDSRSRTLLWPVWPAAQKRWASWSAFSPKRRNTMRTRANSSGHKLAELSGDSSTAWWRNMPQIEQAPCTCSIWRWFQLGPATTSPSSVAGVRAFIGPASIDAGPRDDPVPRRHGRDRMNCSIGHAHKRLLVLSRWPDDPEAALDRFAGVA